MSRSTSDAPTIQVEIVLHTMPSISYQTLPGPVGDCLKAASLATTASVPVSSNTSLVFTTGHIGLDLKTGALVNHDAKAEFEAIFDCLDAALKNAGVAAGMAQAYRLVSYLVRAEDETMMHDIFRRKYPGHTPTWATVIVKAIYVATMRAEITAEAAYFH